MSIEACDVQGIAPGRQHDDRSPVGNGCPDNRNQRTIDHEGADADGRRAGDGNEITVRAEPNTVVQRDGKVRGSVGRYQREKVTASLAEIGFDYRRAVNGAAVRHERGVFCIQDRIHFGRDQRSVCEIL